MEGFEVTDYLLIIFGCIFPSHGCLDFPNWCFSNFVSPKKSGCDLTEVICTCVFLCQALRSRSSRHEIQRSAVVTVTVVCCLAQNAGLLGCSHKSQWEGEIEGEVVAPVAVTYALWVSHRKPALGVILPFLWHLFQLGTWYCDFTQRWCLPLLCTFQFHHCLNNFCHKIFLMM